MILIKFHPTFSLSIEEQCTPHASPMKFFITRNSVNALPRVLLRCHVSGLAALSPLGWVPFQRFRAGQIGTATLDTFCTIELASQRHSDSALKSPSAGWTTSSLSRMKTQASFLPTEPGFGAGDRIWCLEPSGWETTLLSRTSCPAWGRVPGWQARGRNTAQERDCGVTVVSMRVSGPPDTFPTWPLSPALPQPQGRGGVTAWRGSGLSRGPRKRELFLRGALMLGVHLR